MIMNIREEINRYQNPQERSPKITTRAHETSGTNHESGSWILYPGKARTESRIWKEKLKTHRFKNLDEYLEEILPGNLSMLQFLRKQREKSESVVWGSSRPFIGRE